MTYDQADALATIAATARRRLRRQVHKSEVANAALDLLTRDPELQRRVVDLLGA